MTRLRPLVPFALWCALVFGGCDGPLGQGADDPDAVAEVKVAITTVPASIICVQVSITGSASKTSSFTVTSGGDAVFNMGRFPPGSVAVSAKAFDRACADVTSSVQPIWVSVPKTVVLAPGPVMQIQLLLQKNNPRTVAVDFQQVPLRLAAGFETSYALMDDNTVWRWGLTEESDVSVLKPTVVPSLTNIVEIAASSGFACGRLANGTVKCWGQGFQGSLGDGNLADHIVAPPGVTVMGVSDAQRVMVGIDDTACAINSKGEVFCWGFNGGLFGDGTVAPSAVARKVTDPNNLFAANFAFSGCVGQRFRCEIRLEGSVYCSGFNGLGQLGNGTTADSLTMVRSLMAGATSVTCGQAFACALRADRSLWCWGNNAVGSVGISGVASTSTPTMIEPPGSIVQIASGLIHSCAITSAKKVVCWGRDLDGELGDGNAIDKPERVTAELPADATDLVTGSIASCAMAGGSLHCWGRNNFGELGDGTRINRFVPTLVKW
jgi:alpha-tubulin suppressor-like RCC1 family protein